MRERRVGPGDHGAAGTGEGTQDPLHGVDAALAVEAVADLAGAVREALPHRGDVRVDPAVAPVVPEGGVVQAAEPVPDHESRALNDTRRSE